MKSTLRKYSIKIAVMIAVLIIAFTAMGARMYRPDITFFAKGKANPAYTQGMEVRCLIIERHKKSVVLECTYGE